MAAVLLSSRQFHEPRRLSALLDAVGERIGTGEGRVAASTLQYGVAARCWAIALDAWQGGGQVIDFAGLRYIVTAPGTVDVMVVEADAWDCRSAPADDVAGRIAATVVAQLTALHTAIRAVTRVADGLLWGNAASALVSAADIVGTGSPRSELTHVTTAMLSRPPLADRLVRTSTGGARRRSCCLWYRTAEESNCGDCPLPGRHETRP